MVGFGEVDELEVESEGAGELVGGGFSERADALEGVLERVGGSGSRLGTERTRSDAGGALAIGDGSLAKLFDSLEDGIAGLLAEDIAEQHAERANIAAQRRFLELAGGRLEFSETLRPVGRRPERGH